MGKKEKKNCKCFCTRPDLQPRQSGDSLEQRVFHGTCRIRGHCSRVLSFNETKTKTLSFTCSRYTFQTQSRSYAFWGLGFWSDPDAWLTEFTESWLFHQRMSMAAPWDDSLSKGLGSDSLEVTGISLHVMLRRASDMGQVLARRKAHWCGHSEDSAALGTSVAKTEAGSKSITCEPPAKGLLTQGAWLTCLLTYTVLGMGFWCSEIAHETGHMAYISPKGQSSAGLQSWIISLITH